jgi:hypothetical protein
VGWRYFVGNDAHARWYYKSIGRAVDSDINPRGGREFTVDVMYAMDDLFTSGEFEYGVNPDFDENDFGQYTIDWREYVALPGWRHTLQVRLMVVHLKWTTSSGFTWAAWTGCAVTPAAPSAVAKCPATRRTSSRSCARQPADVVAHVQGSTAACSTRSAAPDDGNLPDDDPALGQLLLDGGWELRFNQDRSTTTRRR